MITEEELQFLKEGDRVRAVMTVYDARGCEDQGPIRAEIGDEGVCIHTQDGYAPTVRFDRTGGATMVFPDEVEKI